MLDTAFEKDRKILLERAVVALDAERFAALTRLLEAPLAKPEAVKKLLHRKAPWERT